VTGDYLWDRTGWPDPELVCLERVLGTLGLVPSQVEGLVPSRVGGSGLARARSTSRSSVYLLLATAAAVVGLVALSWWQMSQPAPGLEVTRLAGTPTIASRPITDRYQLSVGRWLETDAAARASIDVASVGRVEVEPDTRIGLVSTRPGDYRLHLARGTMQAVIWAPPGQFSVKTPSSTAVDLGCVYTMTVDDDGVGLVQVTVGWVGFEWRGRESFIPAGAVCVTRPGLGPGTPHYEDTSDAFRAALTLIDVRGESAVARTTAIGRLLAEARARDVVTLWHLLSRVEVDQRDRVFDRLAGFVPPPADVTREGVRAGRREMLDEWWDALNLGTATWWRTWKQQWRDSLSGR
jgi:hypothetical protein